MCVCPAGKTKHQLDYLELLLPTIRVQGLEFQNWANYLLGLSQHSTCSQGGNRVCLKSLGFSLVDIIYLHNTTTISIQRLGDEFFSLPGVHSLVIAGV